MTTQLYDILKHLSTASTTLCLGDEARKVADFYCQLQSLRWDSRWKRVLERFLFGGTGENSVC